MERFIEPPECRNWKSSSDSTEKRWARLLHNCSLRSSLLLSETPKDYRMPSKPINILPWRLFVTHLNHSHKRNVHLWVFLFSADDAWLSSRLSIVCLIHKIQEFVTQFLSLIRIWIEEFIKTTCLGNISADFQTDATIRRRYQFQTTRTIWAHVCNNINDTKNNKTIYGWINDTLTWTLWLGCNRRTRSPLEKHMKKCQFWEMSSLKGKSKCQRDRYFTHRARCLLGPAQKAWE